MYIQQRGNEYWPTGSHEGCVLVDEPEKIHSFSSLIFLNSKPQTEKQINPTSQTPEHGAPHAYALTRSCTTPTTSITKLTEKQCACQTDVRESDLGGVPCGSLGFGVWGLGFRVWGLWVWASGFRVWGTFWVSHPTLKPGYRSWACLRFPPVNNGHEFVLGNILGTIPRYQR